MSFRTSFSLSLDLCFRLCFRLFSVIFERLSRLSLTPTTGTTYPILLLLLLLLAHRRSLSLPLSGKKKNRPPPKITIKVLARGRRRRRRRHDPQRPHRRPPVLRRRQRLADGPGDVAHQGCGRWLHGLLRDEPAVPDSFGALDRRHLLLPVPVLRCSREVFTGRGRGRPRAAAHERGRCLFDGNHQQRRLNGAGTRHQVFF